VAKRPWPGDQRPGIIKAPLLRAQAGSFDHQAIIEAVVRICFLSDSCSNRVMIARCAPCRVRAKVQQRLDKITNKLFAPLCNGMPDHLTGRDEIA
jgi:O-succinylbenzoate synthase